MIFRERTNVIQLYRSVYDVATKRSRTLYLGAFQKYGDPSAELLAKLTEPERQRLQSLCAARAEEREVSRSRYQFNAAPAELRRIAAWLRHERKSPELMRGAKQIRDAYAELYGVMRTLGIARLRAPSTRRARSATPDSPPTGDTPAANPAPPGPQEAPGVPGPAPAGAPLAPTAAPPSLG